MSEMKKRWIALYVENQVGVLAKVSGLFSGKSYNLQSLTVGTTEDESVSRMTISVASDDITFEQIKKQLNRMVEVIKVIDLTDVPLRLKELMFVKIMDINETQMTEVFHTASCDTVRLCGISSRFQLLSPCTRQVTHALLTRPPLSHKIISPEGNQIKCFVRLACVKHAASVHPEPGSNSHVKS